MKNFLKMGAVVLVLAFAQPVMAESWSFEYDKKLHFSAGVLVGCLNPVMRSAGTDRDSILAPMVASVAVASAKEFIDSRDPLNYWSWADIAYTVAGTSLSVSLWSNVRMMPTPEGIRVVGWW